MTLDFIPSELKRFSIDHSVIVWDLGTEYCVLDWLGLGLAKPTSYGEQFAGLVTRKRYLENIDSLEDLRPSANFDSLLLPPIQLAKFLRWPPEDPTKDSLLSGTIGWVPPECGPMESRLPAAAQNFLSKIRSETDFKPVSGAKYSMEVELMAASINTLLDPSNAAKILLSTYGNNLEEVAKYTQYITARQDVCLRLEFAETAKANLQKGALYGRTKLTPSLTLEHYAGGPNLLLFTLPQYPQVAAKALEALVKNVANYWLKIIPE